MRARPLLVLVSLALAACGADARSDGSSTHDGALVLNGDGWVMFPDRGDAFDLVPGGERTISLWIRYTRPQYHAKILYKMTPLEDGGLGWAAFVHQYSTSLGFWHRSLVPLDASGFTKAGTVGTRKIGDGAWHHIALVQRDTLVEGWTDGHLEFVEDIRITLPQLANDSPVWLGWSNEDVVRFDGEVDEMSLWSRALSRRQIRALMYTRPATDAEGLTAYWPMDQEAGDGVPDATAGHWDGEGTDLQWGPASRPLGPPLRERAVFPFLMGALALGVLYGILLLYGRRLQAQKRKLERQVEARVQDLAQTNEEKDRALQLVASQAERLKELDETKRRFFTNISHEFRTPLSLIVGPLSGAIEKHGDRMDQEVRQSVDTALRSGRRLGHLTSQLLDLARLENRAIRLDTRPLDLGELLTPLTESFGVAARREGVTLCLVPSPEPLIVEGDPERLETVFVNLLANALRFTPTGKGVTLHVAKASGTAVVEVRDEGPGVPPDERGRIFERFYQTPLGIQTGGGTGVGLALVRELVELHGGHVELLDSNEPGAVFRVTLPLSDAEPEAVSPRTSTTDPTLWGTAAGGTSSAPTSDGSEADWRTLEGGAGPEGDAYDDADRILPPLVLVVEDHAELRTFLRSHLSRRFRVEEAADGAAALAMARRRPPDVIVSDVMMPDVDGLQLLTSLRSDPDLDSIPFVLLTARAEVEHRIEGLESGADDYISKPFEAAELTARVRNLIDGRRRLRRHFLEEWTRGEGAAGHGPHPERSSEDLGARLQHAVLDHLGDPDFGVSELAACVAMERTGLYRTMMDELDMSPSDFMRRIRLDRAGELLRAGNTVAEVAYAVGYQSVSSFSRRFQEHFGARPGQWAREGDATGG